MKDMMDTMNNNFLRAYVSVDCVIFGFDKSRLNVLLVQRNSLSHSGKSLKLPGSLIDRKSVV
jgi:hypothetical protein